MPKIQEQPSMEDETHDEIEDVQLRGVNDIGMDSSKESEMIVQPEEINFDVDATPPKPVLKEIETEESAALKIQQQNEDILNSKRSKKDQPDFASLLNSKFIMQKSKTSKMEKNESLL